MGNVYGSYSVDRIFLMARIQRWGVDIEFTEVVLAIHGTG